MREGVGGRMEMSPPGAQSASMRGGGSVLGPGAENSVLLGRGGDDDVENSGLTVAEERGEGGRPVAARDASMLAPRAYPSSSLSPWTASYSTLTLS